jgi:hypothetical protein
MNEGLAIMLSSSGLIVLLFLALAVALPAGFGFLCRRIVFRSLSVAGPRWLAFAQVLTFLGWGAAFVLGNRGVMSYSASVLLGSVLFAPGHFLWALWSQPSRSEP